MYIADRYTASTLPVTMSKYEKKIIIMPRQPSSVLEVYLVYNTTVSNFHQNFNNIMLRLSSSVLEVYLHVLLKDVPMGIPK